jgi:DNA-binding NarL/FixJ family response regulator
MGQTWPWTVIEKSKYDLILMDIQMPNMGGIDVARITREKLGPECPAAEPAVHLAVEYSIEFSSPRLRQKDRGSRSALAV